MLNKIRKLGVVRWYVVIIPILWLMIMASIDGLCDFYRCSNTIWINILWISQGILMFMMIIMSGIFTHKMFKEDKINRTNDTQTRHLVVLPCYQEPLSVIYRSVESVLAQTVNAKQKIILIISLEEKTKDLHDKVVDLMDRYCNKFLLFDVTVHPFGLANEIPGKCSNGRWAVTHGEKVIQEKFPTMPIENVIMTSMDADTELHKKYMSCLEFKYNKLPEQKKHASIWQAAQLFNWGLSKSNFITRVTAIYRTVWMIGFNIPFKVHSMAVFSSSLLLCRRNNYFNPSYQMDDLHYFVSCMATTKGKLKLRAINLPIICGPTSGKNQVDEVYEWARQVHRWSVGAFEIFHCVVICIKKLGVIKSIQQVSLLFMMYGFFQSLMAIITFLSFPVWSHNRIHVNYPYLWMIVTSMPFIFTIWCLFLDGLYVRKFKLHNEKVGLIQNLKDLALSPVVMILYNAISLFSLHHLLVRGKSICKHKPSSKSNLRLDSKETLQAATNSL